MNLYVQFAICALLCGTLLGLAVAGAGHLLESWLALGALAALGLGILVVAIVCTAIVYMVRAS